MGYPWKGIIEPLFRAAGTRGRLRKEEPTWHRTNPHATGHAHCAVREHVLVEHGKEHELPIDPTTEPLDTPVDQTALLGGAPESMRRGRRLEFRSRTPRRTARKLPTN
jgi:hypothetical protein